MVVYIFTRINGIIKQQAIWIKNCRTTGKITDKTGVIK